MFGNPENVAIPTKGLLSWAFDNQTYDANKLVTLIDDDGNDISGYKIQGDICVCGPTVFQGYLQPWSHVRFLYEGK